MYSNTQPLYYCHVEKCTVMPINTIMLLTLILAVGQSSPKPQALVFSTMVTPKTHTHQKTCKKKRNRTL